MQYLIQQTPKEIRLVTLSDISDEKVTAQMKGFRVQTGMIETWTKDETMPASFSDRLLKHGYTAITETQYLEYLNTAKEVLLGQAAEPNGKDYTIVPWETIAAQFAPPFWNEVTDYLTTPALRQFCLYPGNTVIDGDLVIDFSELGTTAQTTGRNIIVNGNLTIKGNFDGGHDIESLPQFVYITGDLHANNLLLSGWLDMIVAGNVTITGTLLGYYGEPGGRLLVKGNLHTSHLLNGFMYQIQVEGQTHGACYSFEPTAVEGFSVQQIESSFTDENELVEYPLIPAVVPYDKDTKEYGFRFEEACGLLRKGTSIFR